MKNEDIKSNLRDYYNIDAQYRNSREKDEWKLKQRDEYLAVIKSENKSTLLELGAGTGHDSKFFMDNGLNVTAVDLSPEMVKLCREKSINAYELDFYHLSELVNTFDCIWAMNTLLHVPKSDLFDVLRNIDSVLNDDGIFYMGVYGGVDKENNFISELCDIPRHFSFYTKDALTPILSSIFDIISSTI